MRNLDDKLKKLKMVILHYSNLKWLKKKNSWYRGWVRYNIDFESNGKSLHSKNDSKPSSVYKDDYYVIKINNNKFNLIIIYFILKYEGR